MGELVKSLASINDPLKLIAFLGILLLAAFRTKRVPELI